MPGTKEIRTKIASVKSTQKITKAMQMVATSKMRRAQDRMKQARPYAQKMRNVIGHLTEANPDYRHPFLHERDVKGVGIIVLRSPQRRVCIIRRSSPYGSLTARHSVSNTIVERRTRSNACQSLRPEWLGFPVLANDTHASAIFPASM